MRMKNFLLFITFILFLIFFVQSAQSYRLTNNLYFAIPNDSIECIDVILPDDSGFMGMGEYEYKITCTSNWSDLTEQIVRTDENNTVRIPLCFSGFGRDNGDCSPPFMISISSSMLGIENNWSGGVCISKYPDFDIVDEEVEDEDDVWNIINGNVDFFDIGFSPGILHVETEKIVTYSLLVESYASLTIDLGIKNTALSISPLSETVQSSSSNPYHKIGFTINTPTQNGEYNFDVEANIRNCEGIFCRKVVKGILVVNDTLPETGVLIYLFPQSINVKSLEPVIYMLTIQNYEEEKTFLTSINIDPDTLTDFPGGSVVVAKDSYKTIEFTVTPNNVSSLYQIDVTVEYEGLEKKVSAALSTNEMLTDAMRNADYIKNSNPNLTGDVNSALDDWYNDYKTSDYGTDMDNYATLKDSLADLMNQTVDGETPGDGGPYTNGGPVTDGQDQEEGSWLWIVLLIIIVIVVIILLVMFFKKSKKTDETEEEYF